MSFPDLRFTVTVLPLAGKFSVIDFSSSNCVHSQITDIGVLVDYRRAQMAEYFKQWHSINTVEACYEANMELLVPQPRFTLDSDWPILNDSSILAIYRTSKEDNIVNILISPGCVIKGRVENSVLSPGVHIAEQAVVRNSVVMGGASIGYHSMVDSCILDEGVNIGRFCYSGFGAGLLPGNPEITVIGKDVTIPDRTAIGRKCNVRPGLGPAAFGARRIIPSGTTLVHS